MKTIQKRIWLIVLILIAGLILRAGYKRRFQIEAKIWHWKHGYKTYVGDYEVPVPGGWLMQTFDDPNPRFILLINTQPANGEGPLSAVSVVSVSVLPTPLGDLAFWQSVKRTRLEKEGVSEIDEMALQAGDEKIVCLGGRELSHIVHAPPITAESLECSSTGRLNLMFVGPRSRVGEFESIATQIRKRS